MDDSARLLAHVEALMREVRELRDGQRRMESMLEREAAGDDWRAKAAARQARHRGRLYAAKYGAIFARDGNRCVSCEATEDLTIDHIVPRSKGGTDDPSNLRVLCGYCNSQRCNRTDEEWAALRSNVTGSRATVTESRDSVTPLPFSPLPSPTPLTLSPLSPPQEQKPSAASDEKAIAAPPETLSEFATYLQAEWPDIKRPWEYERRAQAAFPGVSLAAEARKARGWECSNPKNTKRNHGRFLWGWLTRAQDGASRMAAPVFHIEALAKARADDLAEKQRRETQLLLEKQQAERPDRTPPEEAKKRLAALAGKVLKGTE